MILTAQGTQNAELDGQAPAQKGKYASSKDAIDHNPN